MNFWKIEFSTKCVEIIVLSKRKLVVNFRVARPLIYHHNRSTITNFIFSKKFWKVIAHEFLENLIFYKICRNNRATEAKVGHDFQGSKTLD